MLGEELRQIIRCCKRPLDADGALYDAVTALGSTAPLAPYLETQTQLPSVYHHGNRGLPCPQILADYGLFLAVRDALDKDPVVKPGGEAVAHFHALAPGDLQGTVRAAMLPDHPWLDEPAPVRITPAENLQDWARMIVFVLAILLVLTSPGLLLAALIPWRGDLALMIVTAVILTGLAYLNRRGLAGTEVKSRFSLAAFLLSQYSRVVIAAVIYVVGATLVLDPIVSICSLVLSKFHLAPFLTLHAAFRPTLHVVLLGLISLVLLTVPFLLFLVRHNEMRDSSQDAPHTNERILRDMLHREDWVAQNHMGSIVLIKPGILRSIIIRVGHKALFLVLRLVARDGMLGSMRTVHFAHWAFLNNNSRLLFFSNFDHSWGSYLDDFIEKAHAGLSLAWGCGVGFPATRFLIYDGASHGRQFKAWALASRAVSRFWYSAYPDLTVDQVERNNRIANGLRKQRMHDREAAVWMQDL